MTSYDYENKLWYHCGILRFSILVFIRETTVWISGLGCKRSLVQIQSRRPFYLAVITNKNIEIDSFSYRSLLVIYGPYLSYLTTKIVVKLWYSIRRVKFSLNVFDFRVQWKPGLPTIISSSKSTIYLKKSATLKSSNCSGGQRGNRNYDFEI